MDHNIFIFVQSMAKNAGFHYLNQVLLEFYFAKYFSTAHYNQRCSFQLPGYPPPGSRQKVFYLEYKQLHVLLNEYSSCY